MNVDVMGLPIEVAEGCWNQSRGAGMDAGIAFGGKGRPIGSVSDLSIKQRKNNFVGAAGVMQEGKAVVPLLPYARWNLAILIQAKLEKQTNGESRPYP